MVAMDGEDRYRYVDIRVFVIDMVECSFQTLASLLTLREYNVIRRTLGDFHSYR